MLSTFFFLPFVTAVYFALAFGIFLSLLRSPTSCLLPTYLSSRQSHMHFTSRACFIRSICRLSFFSLFLSFSVPRRAIDSSAASHTHTASAYQTTFLYHTLSLPHHMRTTPVNHTVSARSHAVSIAPSTHSTGICLTLPFLFSHSRRGATDGHNAASRRLVDGQ